LRQLDRLRQLDQSGQSYQLVLLRQSDRLRQLGLYHYRLDRLRQLRQLDL